MENLHALPLDDRPPPPHPFVYTLLIVPFGATTGFVTVALAYLATRVGLSVQQGAALIAVSLFPSVWKFFWAPVGDRTLTRKRWYVLSCVACALGMAAMAAVPLGPRTLHVMYGIILATSFAATFLGFAVEGMVAVTTPPHDRGRVSGWFQAGSLGGSGMGGGLGLWLLRTLPAGWQAGLVLAVLTLVCCIPLYFVADVPSDAGGGTMREAVRHVTRDLWQTLKSREGILCGVLCFVPVGTGAAAGVLTQAEVAAHWGAGAHEVEIVQGFLTGGVSMVGCLVGGYLCARLWNARVAYAIFGGLMALVTLAMAYAPFTVRMYVGFNIAYAFVTGLCYAAFSGYVFDAIGGGHVATKYNGFASLSNAPIWYMGLVLAWAETRWGSRGMLLSESALGVLGILVFLVAVAMVARPRGVTAQSAKGAKWIHCPRSSIQ